MSNTYLQKCPFGIYADRAGYSPRMKKRAVLPEKHGRFTVKNEVVAEYYGRAK